jgi:flagellar basal body rod protein FlgC
MASFYRNECLFSFSLAPGKPDDVKLLSINSSQLLLTWQKPQNPNGIIRGYVVTWEKVVNDWNETVNGTLEHRTTEGNVNSFTIRELGESSFLWRALDKIFLMYNMR